MSITPGTRLGAYDVLSLLGVSLILAPTMIAPRNPLLAPTIPDEWRQEFEAAARRSLATRLRYAFIHTHKPILDDAPYRAFATMEEYRAWCEKNLPSWLGYGRV